MRAITGWASFHSDARTRTPAIEAMTAELGRRGPDAGGVRLGERVAIVTAAWPSSTPKAAAGR